MEKHIGKSQWDSAIVEIQNALPFAN